MISKDMYNVLKKIPRSPQKTSYLKLLETKRHDNDVLCDMLEEAINNHYIIYTDKQEYYMVSTSPFCITEAGKIAIEEYKNKSNSSKKATWALIISALSLVSSIIAIILGVQ